MIFLLIFPIFLLNSISANISPDLIQSSKETFDIVLSFSTSEDISQFYKTFSEQVSLNGLNRSEKISLLKSQLISYTSKSQENVLSFLKKSKSNHVPVQMWISNEIFINSADKQLILELGNYSDIAEIREQIVIKLPEFKNINLQQTSSFWGVQKINASSWWNRTLTGQGVTVGHIDSGVRVTHTALSANFLGIYGWFDPQNKTNFPYDLHSHGTHTLATAVGAVGCGVAPGALWMSCLGCPGGSCLESNLKACGQFILCPTLTDGSGQNCEKAPRVVTNSWGADRQALTFYDSVISAWRKAGIIPIFSSGNSGPNCSSLNSPGDHKDVISVGATTRTDGIAAFSSLGPSTRYGASVYKPDITAPGVSILSALADSDTAFGTMDGTSMAAPHVAGAVALLLSKDPFLTYDQVKNALTSYAWRTGVGNGQTCGSSGTNGWPNHVFGHGRLDLSQVRSNSNQINKITSKLEIIILLVSFLLIK